MTLVEVSASSRACAYMRRQRAYPRLQEQLNWLEQTAQSEDSERCVEWPFSKRENGYGRFTIERKSQLPHRHVCRLAHGEPPSKNHDAAHGCRNRLCCNPQHLRWATRRENLADRAGHGTLLKGDRHPRTTVADASVSAMHAKFYALCEQMAAEFNTTAGTVRRILRAESRKE